MRGKVLEIGMFPLLKIRTSIDIFKNEKCKVTFGLEYIKALDLMVSKKKIFLRFPIVSLREMMSRGRGLFRHQEHDRQDLCRVPLIIATHKI